MKKISLSIFLLLFAFQVNANTNANGTIIVENGSYRYKSDHWNKNSPNYRSFNSNTYRAYQIEQTKIRSVISGATSANTVQAEVTRDVSKRKVLDEIFEKAKTAGKSLGKGAAGLGRAAATRHPYGLAFALALEGLAGSRFFWDEEKGDFVKQSSDKNYYLFLSNEANSVGSAMNQSDLERWCAGSVTIHASYDSKLKGMQRTCEDIEIVKESELSKDKYLEKCGGTAEEKYELNAHRACVKENKYMGKAVKVIRHIGYVPINSDDFFNESVPDANKNPTEWVETSEVKPSEPDVSVKTGSVAQTDPYTDPEDGKVKQTRWDFDGKNRVRETVIERPDLDPNSPEAPELKKPVEEEPNEKEKDKEKDKEEKEPKPQEASRPISASDVASICGELDILACDKQPKEPELDEFPEISTEEINLKFAPDSVFPNAGQCPAPVSFQAMGTTYQISTQPICDIAEKMRPFIIALAYLAAAFFVIRTIKSETS